MGSDKGSQNISPPVVLIHGLFMTEVFWQLDNIQRLMASCRVATVALPGHYPEDSLPEHFELSKEGVLAHFDARIEEVFGQEPCFLIGHSTGALMALFYAACRPQRVLGVISVGGAEDGYEEAFSYRSLQYLANHWGALGHAMIRPTLSLITSSDWVYRYFLRETFADPDETLSRPEIRTYIHRILPEIQKLDGRSMAILLDQLQHFDASPELQKMKVPSLIICGDQDCYVSLERTYRLGDLIPGSKVQIFEDCGHFCMWEKPQAFYNVVVEFIESHRPEVSRSIETRSAKNSSSPVT